MTLGHPNGHRWPCPRFFTGHTPTAKCACPPPFTGTQAPARPQDPQEAPRDGR